MATTAARAGVGVGARRWLALALALTATGAVDTKRKVDTLPVYGAPPTAHWTGFVETDAASGSHLFYYLVESADEPASDPLVWWFNGGPGASSFAGLFSENGPLLLNDAGVLVDNPYAWNARANVLYVEFAPKETTWEPPPNWDPANGT